ncbi:peptide deformylase [Sulfurimonas paralvinellae]|uniref:Peptide deformylase-like n=1 Tax=Sulfurimonas paralvinellae TaxID=317658 RepID=A0A7M1B8U5_9BACT|nr:peptide deformylase [Sulfurimonas paralvinellae]QOP46095.1 peptide deformylase [Sulfurimonas paralvinellae]
MVKEIIQYPTPLSVEYGVDVRFFNEELFSLIDDLKDTITQNNLEGLSAFQIGSYFNVIVVKDENGEFIEIINPRLISHSGRTTTEESTLYYPGHTAQITRHENISVVYQNREGENKSLKATGSLAILIQRKIDYTFGATFIQKMSKEEKEIFEKRLEYGADVGNADYCPTTFKRDKIVFGINILIILMALVFIASLFIEDKIVLHSIYNGMLYGSAAVIGLDIVYFFYAQYEAKQQSSCSSCQIGNIMATAAIVLLKLGVVMTLAYFFIYK